MDDGFFEWLGSNPIGPDCCAFFSARDEACNVSCCELGFGLVEDVILAGVLAGARYSVLASGKASLKKAYAVALHHRLDLIYVPALESAAMKAILIDRAAVHMLTSARTHGGAFFGMARQSAYGFWW